MQEPNTVGRIRPVFKKDAVSGANTLEYRLSQGAVFSTHQGHFQERGGGATVVETGEFLRSDARFYTLEAGWLPEDLLFFPATTSGVCYRVRFVEEKRRLNGEFHHFQMPLVRDSARTMD